MIALFYAATFYCDYPIGVCRCCYVLQLRYTLRICVARFVTRCIRYANTHALPTPHVDCAFVTGYRTHGARCYVYAHAFAFYVLHAFTLRLLVDFIAFAFTFARTVTGYALRVYVVGCVCAFDVYVCCPFDFVVVRLDSLLRIAHSCYTHTRLRVYVYTPILPS